MEGWSALILAGGAGRRFGGGKLLAPLAGAPLIRRTVEAVIAAEFAETIAVTGFENAAIRAALSGISCRIVHAEGWIEGMAATLRTGIAALSPEAQGVCIFLGDMPIIPADLCAGLVQAAQAAGFAARPWVTGKPGHPVAFTRAAFTDLAQMTGDRGAVALLKQHPNNVAYLDTSEVGALLDIDYPADLAAAERAWNACATSATNDKAISRGALPNP